MNGLAIDYNMIIADVEERDDSTMLVVLVHPCPLVRVLG